MRKDISEVNEVEYLEINKNIKHLITSCQAISNRVISMTLKLNKRHTLQIIHAYAPTSSSENEEVVLMYEDISHASKTTRRGLLFVQKILM